MNTLHSSPQAIAQTAGQGRALWHFGALLIFKALTSETGGQCWVLEGLADRTMAVPLHMHTHEDELWHILEGEIVFIANGQSETYCQGATVFIPRNTPHTFQVKSARARWFGVGVGGTLDRWFFETGVPARTLTLPPPPAGPPSAQEIQAIDDSLRAYGTITLGPPPAPIQ